MEVLRWQARGLGPLSTELCLFGSKVQSGSGTQALGEAVESVGAEKRMRHWQRFRSDAGVGGSRAQISTTSTNRELRSVGGVAGDRGK